jgi:hypothetical protein
VRILANVHEPLVEERGNVEVVNGGPDEEAGVAVCARQSDAASSPTEKLAVRLQLVGFPWASQHRTFQ